MHCPYNLTFSFPLSFSIPWRHPPAVWKTDSTLPTYHPRSQYFVHRSPIICLSLLRSRWYLEKHTAKELPILSFVHAKSMENEWDNLLRDSQPSKTYDHDLQTKKSYQNFPGLLLSHRYSDRYIQRYHLQIGAITVTFPSQKGKKRELPRSSSHKCSHFFPAIVPYPVRHPPAVWKNRFNPSYIPSSFSGFRTLFPDYLSFLVA